MALFTGVQHLYTFNLVTLLFIAFSQMFGRRLSLLVFCIDRPIAWISSSIVLYRVPRSVLSLWRRYRNRMDSYRLNTVDVPESPIVSGVRGPLQQQRCDFFHCHEE